MKKLLLLSILYFGILITSAQVIPANRTIDWANSGYPDSIPEPSVILDVMSFGAIGDGITDDYAAINSAITSLGGNQGAIYFPPGVYKIGSSLNLPDSVVLRGASSDSTHLMFDLQGAVGNCINITGSISGAFDTIVQAMYGNNAITVTDPSFYQTGMYLELVQNNDVWDTQPVSWADNSVGQIVRIDSVAISGVGGVLYTQSTIRADYNGGGAGLNARIRILNPAREVGIECLEISRADNVLTGVCFNIYFNYAVNCWIRGVESSMSIGSHIEADASSRITITGNYIHDAYLYDGASTHGYGITLFNHTGECRVENNIMRHLRHSFSFQTGANGNVNAYNYSIEPNRSEFPADYGADISMHGHYPFLNLFEGNIVQNIQLDQTWGPSGPYNTFFRNRAELYGILMTSGSVESNEQHFVGNEVTSTAPFTGNYMIFGTGHVEHGNMIQGVLTPAGTTPLNDSSYYLNAAPSFWGSTGAWPSIGIPNTPGAGSIPARDRYLAGGQLTVCREDFTTHIATISKSQFAFTVSPNPFSQTINIYSSGYSSEYRTIRCHDLSGRLVFEKQQVLHAGKTEINFPQSEIFTNGFYVLTIRTEKNIQSVKLLKHSLE
ncbi:MAG: T9SS type A sorting domain-containing protein [Bacteroidia bacterium]|nr:T9SS type A sorting domain-containing protein [Bacteroidia bacterium]